MVAVTNEESQSPVNLSQNVPHLFPSLLHAVENPVNFPNPDVFEPNSEWVEISIYGIVRSTFEVS